MSTKTKAVSVKAPARTSVRPLPSQPSNAPKRIGKTEAAELILGTKGKIFSVTVDTVKTKGRILTGRLDSTKKVKKRNSKGTPNVSSLGMVRIYDMVEHAWKTINLQTVKAVRTGGINYVVR